MKCHWNPIRVVLVWTVRAYQTFISPALPQSCKYYPSCSQYAVDALSRYGVFRGSVLAAWRLLRCNPLSYGGYDPVERQRLFGLSGNGEAACACKAGHATLADDLRKPEPARHGRMLISGKSS
ncbi:MAG: membrane protein insertion efficiency factor YidD [Actinobacteria bacterium RBG_16_64_13]|nr:MAG: membrane protein insertion efficiency factor YidD [Actinobacteria bacterium RBG_16_64_13]